MKWKTVENLGEELNFADQNERSKLFLGHSSQHFAQYVEDSILPFYPQSSPNAIFKDKF